MSMLLTRAKVKAEKVADVEASIKRLVPAFEQAQLNGRYPWFRLDNGVTFVILTEVEQGPPSDQRARVSSFHGDPQDRC